MRQITSAIIAITLFCLVADHRDWWRSSAFVSAASGKKSNGNSSSRSGGGRWKCDEKDEKIADNIIAKMITIGRDDTRFPETTSQFKTFCKGIVSMTSRMDTYKEACLRDSAKQISSLLVYTIRGNLNLYCKNPNSRRSKNLISSAKCANTANPDYHRCLRGYIDQLCAIWDSKDSKQKLGQMCCGYEQLFECIRKGGSRHSACDEKSLETNLNFARSIADSSVNLLCADYVEPSDKCDNFKLIALEPPTEKTKNHPKYAKYHSFLTPLVHTLSNL